MDDDTYALASSSGLGAAWYHGKISRRTAEQILMETQPMLDCFLVRESVSTPGSYVLSVKYKGKVQHFLILRLESGLYEVEGAQYGFQSLSAIVEHYKQYPITLNGEKLGVALSSQDPQLVAAAQTSYSPWQSGAESQMPPPAQYTGMPHQPQFVLREQQTLGIAAETSMQMYPEASLTPATWFQQSHMGYPPTSPQPRYQGEPAPTTGYPPQQPTGYMIQGADAGATWPPTSPITYPMPMSYHRPPPPTPPAKPHPSTLPRYNTVDYPPSVQHRQPRHSLPAQPTIPPFGTPTTGPAVNPTHAGVPVLPGAQQFTSVTSIQHGATVEASTQQKQLQDMPDPNESIEPHGYNVIDVFQEGNIIQLIPRGGSAPIKLSGSHIKPHGDFLHPESKFTVAVPFHGFVLLRSFNKPGCHITIDKRGRIKGDGKDTGDKACHFKVHPQESGNKRYICLESVKYPGWFLSTKEDCKKFGPSDKETQFLVRVEQWISSSRKSFMKAFGRASIANKLIHGATIQLKGKTSNMYLRINKRGVVDEVIDADDNLTYFILIDRGMGVVSLHSYQHGGHRIRISNSVLEGKGDPDPPADFYLKETRDSTVAFESVTCPGTFVGVGKEKEQSLFSVYLLDIERHGKKPSVRRVPVIA